MTSSHPNLLYIFADQMRGRDMACAGNNDVLTPNLDRLAAEGVRFVNATSCIPVCTPARACLLTGRFPLSTGMFLNDLQLSVSERTIAHAAADAGYSTAYVGKWHLDGGQRWGFTPPGPRRQGFEHWHAINCDHRDYLDPIYYAGADSTPQRPGVYATDHETDMALTWMDELQGPWCMFLSWSTPHNPYHQLPERWSGYYDPAALTLPANTPDTQAHRRDLAGYYGHISALDECVGRLLDGLETRGLAQDTIVVFTSDHGDMLGAQGVYRKQWPWDESAVVPLIVRGPESLFEGASTGHVAADRTCAVPFSIEDSAPTLLHWMGVPAPASMEGRNLAPAIAGKAPAPTSSVLMSVVPFSETRGDAWRAVRTPRHTYARTHAGPWLLYDNIADPDQLTNLVDAPGAADMRASLEAELDNWLRQLHDSFDEPEQYLQRYGYQVEAARSAPYTYDLTPPIQVQVACRRQDLQTPG